MRYQASLGKRLKQVDNEDLTANELTFGTVTKVNYQYNTVEVRTARTYSGHSRGDDGKLAVPYPVQYSGKTPEGLSFGNVPLITPNTKVLVGFIDGDRAKPIILSVYNSPDTNKLLNPTPIQAGDTNNQNIYKYSSVMFNILPSLNYSFEDGTGTIVRTLNGKSFISVSSDDNEIDMVTDFMSGASYDDFYTSKYGNGDTIEPRIQESPRILMKHQGIITDDPDDNHVTMFFLDKDGTYRRSTMQSDKQFRTTVEQDTKGNYRTRYEADSLILDEGQDYIEFGIKSETQTFYIVNPHHTFEFTDEGLLIDGKPLLAGIDEGIDEAFKKLQEVQDQINKIDELLSGLGEEDLRELINKTNTAIENTSKLEVKVDSNTRKIDNVSTRTEGIIKQFQDFRDNVFLDFKTDTDSAVQELRDKIKTINEVDIPNIKYTEKKYRQTTYRDIKIHADLPLKFKGYDDAVANNKVTYYFPQGFAIHNGLLYIISSAPEGGTKRVVTVYDETYNQIKYFYAGYAGGEGLHVENEGSKLYLYARSTGNKLAKYDITNFRALSDGAEVTPTNEFDINAFMNFFRTDSGWGVEYNNQSKGVFLQRDTLVFFNKDFTKKTGYLWINPSNSTLWSSDLLNSVTNYSAKKQGMTMINNTIIQTLGGNYNPSRDKDIHTYHLQGVQEISPSGDIMNDFTYSPKELNSYLNSIGKSGDILELEGAFNYNNRLFAVVVYKSRAMTDSDKGGVLLIEYKPSDKEYTFNKMGEPFLAPTANYNPYKTNLDGYLYNEYTGDRIDNVKDLIRYMVGTFQSNIVFYSSKVTMKDENGDVIPSALRVEVENMNNYTFFIKYFGLTTDSVTIINYNKSQDTFNVTPQNNSVKYDQLDLNTVTYKLEGYATNCSNTPTVTKHGFIESKAYGTNSRLEFTPYNEYATYANINLNGTWQGWKKISDAIVTE